ncbi:MAG: hypothetical protein K6L73_08620 [Cellvibrionaceae bacterium]
MLLLGGLTVGILNFSNKPEENKLDQPEQSYSGLPWQITPTPEGYSEVFGFTLGTDNLATAIQSLGPDHEIALIETDTSSSIEAYDANYTAGPIKGRLVLVADVSPEKIKTIRNNAAHVEYLETGNKKFTLNKDDRQQALNSLIKTVTFIPVINLDEEIITQRFGKADKTITRGKEETIYLFPKKGLSISLYTDTKEVLQYVAPKNFSWLSNGVIEKISTETAEEEISKEGTKTPNKEI